MLLLFLFVLWLLVVVVIFVVFFCFRDSNMISIGIYRFIYIYIVGHKSKVGDSKKTSFPD